MRKRFYVGCGKNGDWQVFGSTLLPTLEAYPMFGAVIGPFKTKRGAQFMRRYGKGNPHVQCVNDAERLAKQV